MKNHFHKFSANIWHCVCKCICNELLFECIEHFNVTVHIAVGSDRETEAEKVIMFDTSENDRC